MFQCKNLFFSYFTISISTSIYITLQIDQIAINERVARQKAQEATV